jgi:Amidases related to nicotinamidase|tara:strand:+ start:56 stop:646 length:591 start_codon:yes stop_codon:yes gene_type:complete
MTDRALILIDMQNDFLNKQGAYSRAGVTSENLAKLPEQLAPVVNKYRDKGLYIISTHFTLVPSKNGEPLISEHLKKLRPFLTKGDFVSGSFGHGLIDELGPSDVVIEKIAYSAFYMTRLEWVLEYLKIKDLVFGGIVTNGGVSSTVRDAHVRGYNCTVLSDGCAAFDNNVHQVSIQALESIARVVTCNNIISEMDK